MDLVDVPHSYKRGVLSPLAENDMMQRSSRIFGHDRKGLADTVPCVWSADGSSPVDVPWPVDVDAEPHDAEFLEDMAHSLHGDEPEPGKQVRLRVFTCLLDQGLGFC